MWIRKKTFSLIIIYFSAALLVVSVFCLMGRDGASGLSLYRGNAYSHAFGELASSISDLADSLTKASFASSPSVISSTCAKAYADASAAGAALGSLPYSDMELEKTSSFLSRAGDYSAFLVRSAASGNSYSGSERENVASLASCARTLEEEFTKLNAYLISGELTPESLEFSRDALDELDENLSSPSFASSFKKLEAEFPELPELNYDGALSDHVSGLKPLMLKDSAPVTEDAALKAASKFTGLQESVFHSEGTRESGIPVYVVSASTRRGPMTLEITKSGGYVIYYQNSRLCGSKRVSSEDAVRLAEEFLKERGIRDMEAVYWQAEENKLSVSFAYSKVGIKCYPDLIKVEVALDNGEIVSYEGKGYISCHAERTAPEAIISDEEAESRIPSDLTVVSHSMAYFPTEGKREVYCHELKCEDKDGNLCLIYINAETGEEQAVQLLIENESGTLAH